MKQLYVIAVGGSLIVPDDIDTDFLKRFRNLIVSRVKEGDRFILIAGGGKVARRYQEAAASVAELDGEEKDWIGIHGTRLNAHLLKTIFKKWANPYVFKDFDKDDIEFKESILVGAGWKPGCSTDYDAVLLAERYEADTVINLSNISHVYSADPKIDPNATKYDNISWGDYRKLIGDKWIPGMSAPFDPVASRKAEEMQLKVLMMDGKDLDNLKGYLEGKEFDGTLIR